MVKTCKNLFKRIFKNNKNKLKIKQKYLKKIILMKNYNVAYVKIIMIVLTHPTLIIKMTNHYNNDSVK